MQPQILIELLFIYNVNYLVIGAPCSVFHLNVVIQLFNKRTMPSLVAKVSARRIASHVGNLMLKFSSTLTGNESSKNFDSRLVLIKLK